MSAPSYGVLGVHTPAVHAASTAAILSQSPYRARIQTYRCCCEPLIRLVQAIAAFINQIIVRIGQCLGCVRVIAKPIVCVSNTPHALLKMSNNFFKACKEHGVSEAISPAVVMQKQKLLSFACTGAENIGDRQEMQDRAFFLETNGFILSGVFDGHGTKGGDAAEEAATFFKEKFPGIVKSSSDMRTAFHTAMKMAHEQMATKYLYGGTTAVVCFIDKSTNLIYTATVADSEAKIFRKVDGKLTCIPLSCIRNWTSEKDQTRAKAVEPTDTKYTPGAKTLRFQPGVGLNFYDGLNVSRCLGDGKYSPPCTSKPKVTICQLLSGDIVVEGSDGLWDYVSPEELLQKIKETKGGDLAQEIVQFALAKGKEKHIPRDNIGVNVLRIS